jgi:hypothetical protein
LRSFSLNTVARRLVGSENDDFFGTNPADSERLINYKTGKKMTANQKLKGRRRRPESKSTKKEKPDKKTSDSVRARIRKATAAIKSKWTPLISDIEEQINQAVTEESKQRLRETLEEYKSEYDTELRLGAFESGDETMTWFDKTHSLTYAQRRVNVRLYLSFMIDNNALEEHIYPELATLVAKTKVMANHVRIRELVQKIIDMNNINHGMCQCAFIIISC